MRKSLILIFLITGLASPAHAGWTPPVRISDEGYSLDPGIAANGDTLHVVYWIWTGHAECYYLRSTDEGVSWASPFYLSDPLISSGEDSPEIHAKGDTIMAIWYQDIAGSGVNLGFRKSLNGGGEWSDVSLVLPTDSYMLQKHTFCISGSKVFLIYSHWAQEIIVEFTKSTNWGQTWAEPTEIFRTEQTGRFDMVTRGDTIHSIWVGRFNYDDEWEIYYTRSTDSGDSWSENTILSTLDDEGSDWPSVAINDRGELIVCWMDYKYSPNLWRGDLFVRYSYDSGESWSEEEQITFTHDAIYPNVIWQGDSIHVVWEDWRYDQGDIFYMLSEDNGTTWGEQQRIEDDPGMSLAPDLAVADETVHVVWRQDSGMDGRGIYYSRWDEVSEIPTLSEWAMLVLALLVLAVGTLAVVRRSIISKRQDVISFPS
jgi:hypothetical protein